MSALTQHPTADLERAGKYLSFRLGGGSLSVLRIGQHAALDPASATAKAA